MSYYDDFTQYGKWAIPIVVTFALAIIMAFTVSIFLEGWGANQGLFTKEDILEIPENWSGSTPIRMNLSYVPASEPTITHFANGAWHDANPTYIEWEKGWKYVIVYPQALL